MQKNFAPVSRQWQLPIGLQVMWGGLFLIGMLFQKESVRWLVKQGRYEEAWKNLIWIRADSSEKTVEEFEDLKLGIAAESVDKAGLTVGEMLNPVNRKRLFMASILFLFQQATGSNALASFSPQFFALVVGKGNENILITGLFGAVKVVACSFFIFVIADRFGRKILLTVGSLLMFSCMLPTAIVLKEFPPPSGTNPTVDAPSAAIIALIFINIAFYNNSWGPLTWAYTPEIFNTRTRGAGMAFAVAIHWAFSVCFTISAPYQIAAMGWGVFLFYAAFDLVMGAYCAFFLKETKGKSLEGLDREMTHTTVEDQKHMVHGDRLEDSGSEKVNVELKDEGKD